MRHIGGSNRQEIDQQNTPEWANELESAVADIQLFGSSEQVTLARTFALEFAEHGHAGLDELLESLRIDLRKELDLGVPEDRITYLRIGLDRKSASK